MIANFTDISLSFDGYLRYRTCMQRPAAEQRPSFGRVAGALAALNRAGFSYGIRMTAMRAHLDRLSESKAYLLKNPFEAVTLQLTGFSANVDPLAISRDGWFLVADTREQAFRGRCRMNTTRPMSSARSSRHRSPGKKRKRCSVHGRGKPKLSPALWFTTLAAGRRLRVQSRFGALCAAVASEARREAERRRLRGRKHMPV
jgi:hypothetical protein